MQALANAVNTNVGTVVTNAVEHSLADAAGDLAVGSAADTFGRLALGTDDSALTVEHCRLRVWPRSGGKTRQRTRSQQQRCRH